MASSGAALVFGRYALEEPIASGGMATIYLGHQTGAVEFSRVVAIKRLLPQYAAEPEFVRMFLDEARLAARVRHPNVVETLDVVREGAETFIVMQYVDGESLAGLWAALRASGERAPLEVAASIGAGLCRGLHAAHEARGPDGAPLGIVHRDVSPQNVLIGADGIPRVVDFGVALANVRLSHTRAGQVKGKPAYMAPEQLSRDEVTRATDIYAAGVVLWELCAGRRAYDVANEGALYARVMTGAIPRLEDVAPWVPAPLAETVHRALRREPAERFASAEDMAAALERSIAVAPQRQVGDFVEHYAAPVLASRRAVAARLDRGAAPSSRGAVIPPPDPSSSSDPRSVPAPPPSLRPPVAPIHAAPRGTHTITSPGPLPARRLPATAAIGFFIAILTAAGAGVAGTWFVLRQTAAAPPLPGSATASGEAPSAALLPADPPQPEETAAPPPDEAPAEASSSAPNVDRMRPAKTATSAEASSAPATAPRPCDPPYFIDAQGIRRVKRACF